MSTRFPSGGMPGFVSVVIFRAIVHTIALACTFAAIKRLRLVEVFYYLVQSIVILAVVIIFGGSIFVRLAFKGHRVVQDHSYAPSVTVLMSCFNEGQAVYETIKKVLESEYPADNLHVVAIDDCSSDDSWDWMQKAAAGHPNVRVIRNQQNLGKPKSLLKALSFADTELILNIDSDGALHPRAIIELSSCFVDPKVGAVGGNVMVRNSTKNWLTQLQTLQYTTTFQFSKVGETFSGSVSCISGAIFMVRKAIYDKIQPQIKARRWMGHEVKDGEDRFMTNLILMEGYNTIINNRAKVFTDVPSDFSHFFSQQLRWRRGTVRLFLWSLQWNVITKMIKMITPLAFVKFYLITLILIMWPILLASTLVALGIGPFILAKLSLVVLSAVVSGIAYIWAKTIGNELHLGPLPFMILPIWMVVDLFVLTILSTFTLTSTSWETRGSTI